MNNVLLTAGVASVILAVVGGGAQAFGVTVPVLNSLLRQALLGLVGIVFLVMAFAGDGGRRGGNDDDKAREIQTSLVRDVRRAVNAVTLTGKQLATRTAHGNAVFNGALRQWGNDGASIETRLETYYSKAEFEGEPIPRAWAHYSQAVENLYFLSGTEVAAAVPSRCDRVKQLMAYLRVSTANLKCPKRSWTTCSMLDEGARKRCSAIASKQWAAACDESTLWNALALCDEDSLKPSGEGYRRGDNYFGAYQAAISKLRRHEDRLLRVLRTTTPAGP